MIALDLDNCIVCYDHAFRSAASRLGCLPDDGAVDKQTVKAEAFARGGNDLWTLLQGHVYGEGIRDARLFPGCRAFVDEALRRGEELVVISHKTQFPARGPEVDLRVAAQQFLREQEFPEISVHFCDTREEKVARLASMNCRAIVDDLPEVFHTPSFPGETLFVLFDPSDSYRGWQFTPRVSSWDEASKLLLSS